VAEALRATYCTVWEKRIWQNASELNADVETQEWIGLWLIEGVDGILFYS
jgi:hypothetical protein